MSKSESKLIILQLMREKKDILFGPFSDKVSKNQRIAVWKEILILCKSLGLVPGDKDYSYVRDTFWSNLKRATLAKKNNAHRTEAGGGKNGKYTQIDEIVLEIIGENPSASGIAVKEPTFTNVPTEPSPQEANPSVCINSKNNNYNEQVVRRGSTTHDDCEDLKKRKLDLRIEYLKLKSYKLKLETLLLERQLNIPPSPFTSEIN